MLTVVRRTSRSKGAPSGLPAQSDADVERLKVTIEQRHGGAATFVKAVPVWEKVDGGAAWEGMVHVFELTGNARAIRAYAWLLPDAGIGNPHGIYTVLHTPPVSSPRRAVQAALAGLASE